MAALDVDTLKIESKELSVPTLLEVQNVLSLGLPANFAHVSVEVVDCPDLRAAPFHLAAEGLCPGAAGGPAGDLVDIGGPPYLLPHVDRTRIYDLRGLAQRLRPEGSDVLCIGAGASYYPLFGTNCEGVYNLRVAGATGSALGSKTRYAVNVGERPDERCELRAVPAEETRCALLANVFVCEGKRGKVIRVRCKQRIGQKDFVTSIRLALAEHFGPRDEIVGLGGVFVLKRGSARQHVMRDFSATPLLNEEQLNEWLKFYDMPAELIAVGTLITADAGLDLRVQHFHSFSTSNWGGHYHNDTTPDICEYEGYFALGGRIVRVDPPTETHQFGRD